MPDGKRIILLSDGTGNSASQVWKSNVWRVFESLDLRGSDQIAFYDDGVGTSSFMPLAILGGAGKPYSKIKRPYPSVHSEKLHEVCRLSEALWQLPPPVSRYGQ